jgi:hypothetical protein
MYKQSCPWPAAVALALGLALSSCALGEPASGDAPSRADKVKDKKKKKAAAKKRKAAAGKAPATKATAVAKEKPEPPIKPALKPQPKPPPAQVWVCSWSPTYDDDWHNDVLCDNGIASERPRLREGDDFVEQAEMMESAREYARQRNAG